MRIAVHLRHVHVVAGRVQRVRVVRLARGTRPCRPCRSRSISCSGRGIITNGSIGTVGGLNLMMFEPSVGKSFGLGGSSWPDGLTLSVV